jgi:hypothetical protein
MGFGLSNQFIGYSHIINTSNYNTQDYCNYNIWNNVFNSLTVRLPSEFSLADSFSAVTECLTHNSLCAWILWVWVFTTNSQPANLSWNKASVWGFWPDFCCGFVDVGLSLWQEDRSVVYNCWWSSPAQSFLVLSPMGFVIIFYCLRFGTSLVFASYDSHSYSGGVKPHRLLYLLWLWENWVEILNPLVLPGLCTWTFRQLQPTQQLMLSPFIAVLSAIHCHELSTVKVTLHAVRYSN